MKPTVFIHTNAQQLLGAKISAYSLQRASANSDKFDVQIIELEKYPHLYNRDGQTFLRDGEKVIYRRDELQSFTLLRFMPPSLMNFEGRAVVIDPDIFAVGDVYELLSRDMGGKAIMARSAKNGRGYATSSMLMDCTRLQHWQWEKQIDDLFALKRDYQPWIVLELEPPATVGAFEEEWNHFDTLNEKTKLLHNTRRTTQPWKTGLPFEDLHRIAQGATKAGLKSRVKTLFGKTQTHEEHPDTKQRDLFFGLLRECLDKGVVTKEFLQAEIDRKYLRPDAFNVLESTNAKANLAPLSA